MSLSEDLVGLAEPEHILPDMSALVASRICHDLVSPLGASANGLELLSMVYDSASPELSLVMDSIKAANSRIRLFRIAFGAGQDELMISRAEVSSILSDIAQVGRLRIDVELPETMPKGTVKMAFLAILCLESAMPWGGHVHILADGNRWSIHGAGDRLRYEAPLWTLLSQQRGVNPSLSPANTHFALLATEAHRQARPIAHQYTDRSVSLGF